MKKESEEYALLFESGNVSRVEIVESMLRGAGIDCYVKNAGVQNLFGMGAMGGFNPLLGAVKVYVRLEELKAAEEALRQIPQETETADMPESLEVQGMTGHYQKKPILRIGFFLLGGGILWPGLLLFWNSCQLVVSGWNGGYYRLGHIDYETLIAGLFFSALSLVFSASGYLMIRNAVVIRR